MKEKKKERRKGGEPEKEKGSSLMFQETFIAFLC